MSERILAENACRFKAVKGLIFVGKPSLDAPIVTYRRDANTPFYPNHIDLPGGNTDDLDPDAFMTFNRELHEEFGLTIMRKHILLVTVHGGQPQPGDVSTRPSVFLSATIDPDEMRYLTPGNEGTEHETMTTLHYLACKDTIKKQRTLVMEHILALDLLSQLPYN